MATLTNEYEDIKTGVVKSFWCNAFFVTITGTVRKVVRAQMHNAGKT